MKILHRSKIRACVTDLFDGEDAVVVDVLEPLRVLAQLALGVVLGRVVQLQTAQHSTAQHRRRQGRRAG